MVMPSFSRKVANALRIPSSLVWCNPAIREMAFRSGLASMKILVFCIPPGDRVKLHGLNTVGLKRQGFSKKTLSALKKAYRIIFRIGLTLNEAIERVGAEVEQLPEVKRFMEFIKSSTRGITR